MLNSWSLLRWIRHINSMAEHTSKHFTLLKLEDAWMLKSSHVTKDQDGDWMVTNGELHELLELLQSAKNDFQWIGISFLFLHHCLTLRRCLRVQVGRRHPPLPLAYLLSDSYPKETVYELHSQCSILLADRLRLIPEHSKRWNRF